VCRTPWSCNDHFETYKKQFDGDDVRIRRRMERERFYLPDGASFYDLHEKRNEANIGELINIALETSSAKSGAMRKKRGEPGAFPLIYLSACTGFDTRVVVIVILTICVAVAVYGKKSLCA
jgi:hypothetical protein